MKKRTSASSRVVEKQVESETRAVEGTRAAAYAGAVRCPECAHEGEAGDCTERADGSLECPECAAIVKPVAAKGPGPAKTASGERPPLATAPQPSAYCNECGAKWERVDGMPWPNCGHKDGFVDDPAKARSYAPPAGTQRVDRPAPTSTGEGGVMLVVAPPGPKADARPAKPAPMPEAIAPPTVGVVVYPDRVEASWGKSMFRLGDFATFTVGEFKVTRQIDRGASAAEEGERAVEQLEELATRAFKRTLAWYLDKLGLVSDALGKS